MKGVFETINDRSSVREYKEEQLDDAELQKILMLDYGTNGMW